MNVCRWAVCHATQNLPAGPYSVLVLVLFSPWGGYHPWQKSVIRVSTRGRGLDVSCLRREDIGWDCDERIQDPRSTCFEAGALASGNRNLFYLKHTYATVP